MSKIKEINGKQLHAGMLAEAEKAVAGKGDGRISEADAKALVALHQQQPNELTIQTLKHLVYHRKWTPTGLNYLKSTVAEFNSLPVPPTFNFYSSVRDKMGITSLDGVITISYRGAGAHNYFVRWDPVTQPTGKGDSNEMGYDSFAGMSAITLENDQAYVAQTGSYNHIYGFNLPLTGDYHSDAIMVNGTRPTTDYVPNITSYGNAVYLAWVDKTTKCICMAVMNPESQKYTEYTSLFKTVGIDGYEKTNFGVGITPVSVNEMEKGILVNKLKIMVVWLSSEHSNQLCSTFYDPASGKFSDIQKCLYYTGESAIAITTLNNGNVMVATGFPSNNQQTYLETAIYEVNKTSPGGSWNVPQKVYTNKDKKTQYAPTFQEYLGETYLFYVTGKNAISYIPVPTS